MLEYYTRIADVLVPHLKNRAVTLKRYPDGVEGESFYQKNCPAHRPDWLATHDMKRGTGDPKPLELCVINDQASLIYVANLASIELHTYLAKTGDDDRPTMMVFDLDPGPPADIVQCCQVGIWLRDLLGEMKLKSFAKTSGSKGLQVYVPLNSAGVTFDNTKALSRALAEHLEREHSKLVVSKMLKALRKGKVLVDWSQNDEHKTTVCVYSLRAKEEPTVSTPVTWNEVENCLKKKKANLLKFRSDQTLARIEKLGDLFEPVEALKQKLPKKWNL